MTLKIQRLTPNAILPCRAHEGDAGLDVYAAEETVVRPGERVLIGTGFCMELPPGTEAQIRPRSGLALKYGISVLNSPGTIDEAYRGEVKIILINHGQDDFAVSIGMRIAQMVIQPVLAVAVEETDSLSDSRRGAGGFGSTGI